MRNFQYYETNERMVVIMNEVTNVKQTKGRPRGKLKEGTTISCYIRSDIYEKLIEHCEKTGQTKTVAIERAIEKMTSEDDRME